MVRFSIRVCRAQFARISARAAERTEEAEETIVAAAEESLTAETITELQRLSTRERERLLRQLLRLSRLSLHRLKHRRQTNNIS